MSVKLGEWFRIICYVAGFLQQQYVPSLQKVPKNSSNPQSSEGFLHTPPEETPPPGTVAVVLQYWLQPWFGVVVGFKVVVVIVVLVEVVVVGF